MASPSERTLPVPFYSQLCDGYCLAACAQMVLAYLGLATSQESLAEKLGICLPLGAPAFNLSRPGSENLVVRHGPGTLDEIRRALASGHPPIVFAQAGEFPHWRGRVSQHAVVVVGMGAESVHVLDPALETGPASVSVGDFMLAWIEMDCLFGLIARRSVG